MTTYNRFQTSRQTIKLKNQNSKQIVNVQDSKKQKTYEKIIKHLRQSAKERLELTEYRGLRSSGYHHDDNKYEKKLFDGAFECFMYLSDGIAKSEYLKEINISGSQMHSFFTMEIFQGIAQSSNVEHLNISSTNISSFMLSYLFQILEQNQSIKSINIFNNKNINEEVIQDLMTYVCNKVGSTIEDLNIGYCNLSEDSLVKLFYGLAKNNTLLKLKINCQTFGKQALVALGAYFNKFHFFKNQRFKAFEIDLSNNNIGGKGINILKNSLYISHIGKFNLRGNNLQKSDVIQIKKLLKKFNELKVLNLSKNKLTDIQELHTVECFQNLQELNISDNNLKEFDPDKIPNLKKLDISKNKIKFMGALKIANFLKYNPIMDELKLDDNDIKSEGFNLIIFALRQNSHLKHLSLQNNQIQGESLLCLQVNQDALPLQYIDLSYNKMESKQVLMYLSQMKNCELEELKLGSLEEQMVNHTHNSTFQISAQRLKKLDVSNTINLACLLGTAFGSQTFHKIQDLNFANCMPFHKRSISALSKLIAESDHLRVLNLSGIKLGLPDDSNNEEEKNNKYQQVLKTLKDLGSALKRNSSIKQLNLSNNFLGLVSIRKKNDDIAIDKTNLNNPYIMPLGELLDSISDNLTIERLDISYNCINLIYKSSLQNLIEKSKSLQYLSLAGNQIGEIFKKQQNPNNRDKNERGQRNLEMNLTGINLSATKINGDDLKSLGEMMIDNPKLEKLNLSNNHKIHECETILYEKSLDLSYNDLSNPLYLEKMRAGLLKNNSLKKLTLNNTEMGKQSFNKLCDIIQQQKSLVYIEVNKNSFTFDNITKLNQLVCNNHKNLKYISMNCIQNSQEVFSPQNMALLNHKSKVIFFTHIQYLNISNSQLEDQQVKQLFQFLSEESNLLSLDLDRNLLKTLPNIENIKLTKIQEIKISNNLINKDGVDNIFNAVFQCKSLKTLNLKRNNIGDHLTFSMMQNFQNYKQQYTQQKLQIEFLNIQDNNISVKSLNYLKDIFKNFKDLFITNNWIGVDNELAETIINNYINLQSKYSISSEQVPYSFKILSITNSSIDDNVCIYFAKKMIQLKYLVEIDFSNNERITSIGKKYLYIYLFNLAAKNSNLRKFQIQNSDTNPHDNSILGNTYNFLAKKFPENQFLLKRQTKTTKSTLHQNYKFQLNIHLTSQVGVKQLLSFLFIQMVLLLLLYIIQISLLFLIYFYFNKESDLLEDSLKMNIENLSIYCVIIIGIFGICIEIYCWTRVRDLEEQQYRYLNKKEFLKETKLQNIHRNTLSFIKALILQFLDRTELYFDILMVLEFYNIDRYIETLVLLIILIFRGFIRFLNFGIWMIKLQKVNWRQDLGEMLRIVWRLVSSQCQYQLEPYIMKTAPTELMRIGKHRVDLRSSQEIQRFLLTTLPILGFYIEYFRVAEDFKQNEKAYLLLYGLLKQICISLYNVYLIFYFRPSIIHQVDFDDVILYRKYVERSMMINAKGNNKLMKNLNLQDIMQIKNTKQKLTNPQDIRSIYIHNKGNYHLLKNEENYRESNLVNDMIMSSDIIEEDDNEVASYQNNMKYIIKKSSQFSFGNLLKGIQSNFNTESSPLKQENDSMTNKLFTTKNYMQFNKHRNLSEIQEENYKNQSYVSYNNSPRQKLIQNQQK